MEQSNKIEWIKVRDKKPEPGVTVMVLHKAVDDRLAPSVYAGRWWPDDDSPKGGSFVEVTTTCGCCQYFESDQVTHWHPTPEILGGPYITHDEFFELIRKEEQAKKERTNAEIKASKINKI